MLNEKTPVLAYLAYVPFPHYLNPKISEPLQEFGEFIQSRRKVSNFYLTDEVLNPDIGGVGISNTHDVILPSEKNSILSGVFDKDKDEDLEGADL